MPTYRIFYLIALVALLGAAGCARLAVPDEPATPAPLAPVWDQAGLREHLRLLNTIEMGGRATGTRGYARAAAYLAARLHEFRLQPVLENEFRVIYGTPVNHVHGSTLVTVATDSVQFFPGIDYIPDGRSDSGRVAARTVVIASGADPGIAQGDVVLVAGVVADERLQALRRAGARAVIQVGPPTPRLASTPVAGLLVVQATMPTAAALLDVPATSVADLLAGTGARHALPHRIELYVATDYQRQAGAINVLGYVAGKHPVHARESVLVCADLDATGAFAGVPTVDLSHFGRGAAALLETARNYAYIARRWQVPDRTLIFAVWSGARTDHAGLKAYLRQPFWPLVRTRAVVYLGLKPDDEPAVRALLAEAGLSLYVARPDQPPEDTGVFFMPEPAVMRSARRSALEGRAVPGADLSEVLDRAVRRARATAEAAYPIILREGTSLEGLLPTVSD